MADVTRNYIVKYASSVEMFHAEWGGLVSASVQSHIECFFRTLVGWQLCEE